MVKQKNAELNTTGIGSLQELHEALGHINKRKVKELLTREGIKFRNGDEICEDCIKGKQHRATYRIKPILKPTSPGDMDRSQIGRLVHTDLCVSPVPSLQKGYRYFMAVSEDYTRFRKVYFLRRKDKAKIHIQDYLKWFAVQTGNGVKTLLEILANVGCEFQTAAPYTQQPNGLSEKANRTIVDLTRTLMISKNLPRSLWNETVSCVVILMNIVNTSPNNGVAPNQIFYRERPHLARIQPYGMKYFVEITDKQRKWNPREVEAVLIRYEEEVEAYRLWVPSQRRVVPSKDVIFRKHS